jgi:hypothetical protein
MTNVAVPDEIVALVWRAATTCVHNAITIHAASDAAQGRSTSPSTLIGIAEGLGTIDADYIEQVQCMIERM